MPELNGDPNYFVLDTDYDSYSVVYSCSNISDFITFDLLWILAREEVIAQEKLDAIKAVIREELPGYDFEKNAKYTVQGDSCDY